MKGLKKYMAGILVAGMVLGSAAVPAPVYATEAEDAQEDNGDDVEITLDDKPYLALGADLTADQQHTVLSYMGIEAADFDKYDVVYVSNAEEHQYLDSYVPKKQIGTKALSSLIRSPWQIPPAAFIISSSSRCFAFFFATRSIACA